MKKRTGWVLVAAAALTISGLAVVGGIVLLVKTRGGTQLSAHSYLDVSLSGSIPEEPSSSELGAFFERKPPSLRSLVDGLDRAAGDPSIQGVVLRIGLLSDSGWAKAQELRQAVKRFRNTKKPVYAYIEMCGNKEYFVASACTKIYAVPTAMLNVTGLSAEVLFLRKTLDKLGIEAQFEGVGKYKNAPNQYTESSFTEPHREQMEALVDSLFGQYLSAIAAGRGRKSEEVRALLDLGPFDGQGARAAGLVDELLYEDQLLDKLAKAQRVSLGHYLRGREGFDLGRQPKIAVIHIVGEIIPGPNRDSVWGGEGYAGSQTIAAALREARDDSGVKAIMLRVDSPGGVVTAADVIWREVEQARKVKPVVTSFGDVAASGGYYVAMSSDAIVAQPGTITGSIGVFSGKMCLRGLYEKIGMTKEIVQRGENSALFSDYRPWSEAQRARVRSLTTAVYKDFVTKVAQGRKRSYEDIDLVAQGRVWSGSEALERRLVDRLGGIDTALALAKDKAGISKEQKVKLVFLPRRKGLIETLLERQEDAEIVSRLTALRLPLRWATLFEHEGPLARLPFEISIR
jgi:protease IV